MNLLSISSIDSAACEEILDLGLDYVWKTMHCSSIRIQLLHSADPTEADSKPKANLTMKKLLKQRCFKWKTLKNDIDSGLRVETLEGLNLEYKEQTEVESAFIYRRGLLKTDFMRNTFTMLIETEIPAADPPATNKSNNDCVSIPALVGAHCVRDADLRAKLADCEDQLSPVRDMLEGQDCVQVFGALMPDVSCLCLI